LPSLGRRGGVDGRIILNVITDVKRVYRAEERPVTPFMTTKGIKKFLKS